MYRSSPNPRHICAPLHGTRVIWVNKKFGVWVVSCQLAYCQLVKWICINPRCALIIYYWNIVHHSLCTSVTFHWNDTKQLSGRVVRVNGVSYRCRIRSDRSDRLCGPVCAGKWGINNRTAQREYGSKGLWQVCASMKVTALCKPQATGTRR